MNLLQRRKYEGRLLSASCVDSHPEYVLKGGKVSKAQTNAFRGEASQFTLKRQKLPFHKHHRIGCC